MDPVPDAESHSQTFCNKLTAKTKTLCPRASTRLGPTAALRHSHVPQLSSAHPLHCQVSRASVPAQTDTPQQVRRSVLRASQETSSGCLVTIGFQAQNRPYRPSRAEEEGLPLPQPSTQEPGGHWAREPAGAKCWRVP